MLREYIKSQKCVHTRISMRVYVEGVLLQQIVEYCWKCKLSTLVCVPCPVICPFPTHNREPYDFVPNRVLLAT